MRVRFLNIKIKIKAAETEILSFMSHPDLKFSVSTLLLTHYS